MFVPRLVQVVKNSVRALCLLFGASAVGVLVASLVPTTDAEAASPRPGNVHRAMPVAAKVEVDTDLTPTHDGAIRAKASVFVAASSDEVRDAVFDLQARAADGWMVDAVSLYRDDTDRDHIHRRARWELSILGIEITYHCRYDWSRESGTIRWSLDPSRTNDLDLAEGLYELEPRQGGTALTYTVEVGSKHEAAKPIKRSITARNVRKLLESVRTRAEAAG